MQALFSAQTNQEEMKMSETAFTFTPEEREQTIKILESLRASAGDSILTITRRFMKEKQHISLIYICACAHMCRHTNI